MLLLQLLVLTGGGGREEERITLQKGARSHGGCSCTQTHPPARDVELYARMTKKSIHSPPQLMRMLKVHMQLSAAKGRAVVWCRSLTTAAPMKDRPAQLGTEVQSVVELGGFRLLQNPIIRCCRQ